MIYSGKKLNSVIRRGASFTFDRKISRWGEKSRQSNICCSWGEFLLLFPSGRNSYEVSARLEVITKCILDALTDSWPPSTATRGWCVFMFKWSQIFNHLIPAQFSVLTETAFLWSRTDLIWPFLWATLFSCEKRKKKKKTNGKKQDISI